MKKHLSGLVAVMIIISMVFAFPGAAMANTGEGEGTDGNTSTSTGAIAAVDWIWDDKTETETPTYDINSQWVDVSACDDGFDFQIGTMDESSQFQPFSEESVIENLTVSIKKSTWETPIQLSEDEQLSGVEYLDFLIYNDSKDIFGVWYNAKAIFAGSEMVCGTYTITASWSVEDVAYEGTIDLELRNKEVFSKIMIEAPSENLQPHEGFNYYIFAHEEWEIDENTIEIPYNPYIDYTAENSIMTYILSDAENGISNYTGSTPTAEAVFKQGDSVEYKADFSFTPLEIDLSEVTSDMVGQEYSLTFTDNKNGEKAVKVKFVIPQEENIIVPGEVYAIEPWAVTTDSSDKIRISDSYAVSKELKLNIGRYSWYKFVTSDNDYNLSLVELTDYENITDITVEKDRDLDWGDCYSITSDDITSGTLNTTVEGKTISYSFELPEDGLYSQLERNEANYLLDGFYYGSAEKNQENTEAYCYYMMPKIDVPQSDIIVELVDNMDNQLEVEGIAFEQQAEYQDSATGKIYYVWKLIMPQGYSGEGQSFCIWTHGSINEQGQSDTYYLTDVRLYGSNAILPDAQLYWIPEGYYDNSSIVVDDTGKLVLPDTATMEVYAETKINSTVYSQETGYFAILQGGEYYAVSGVTSDAFSIIEGENYKYTLTLSGVAEYRLTVETEDSKEYMINVICDMPDAAVFKAPQRTETNYIRTGEVYFNGMNQNAEGTEAYFYVIAEKDDNNLDRSQLTASFVRYDDNTSQDVAENIENVTLTNIEDYTDSDTGKSYYIWKGIISEEFSGEKSSNIMLCSKEAEDAEGYRYLRDTDVTIYGKQTVSSEEQLYWVPADDMVTDFNTDTGELTLVQEPEENANIYCGGASSGYFAIFKDNKYYAVTLYNPPEWATLQADSSYLYQLAPTELNNYVLSAKDNGSTYMLNLTYGLPYMGWCASETDIPGSIYPKNELWFSNLPKDDDGNAIFYVFVQSTDDAANEYTVSMCEGLDDTAKTVTGITFESLAGEYQANYGGENYKLWKAVVDKENYIGSDDYRFIKVESQNDVVGEKHISLHDAADILPENQLYWVDSDLIASVESDGKLIGKSQLSRTKNIRIPFGSQTQGYFAVIKDDVFYAVNLDDNQSDWAVNLITKNKYLYQITPSCKGKVRFSAANETKFIYVTSELPYIGIYSKPQRSSDAYLSKNIFLFDEAAEKKSDGSEAYFYVIAPKCGLEQTALSVELAKYAEGELKTINSSGISFSYHGGCQDGDTDYYIWKVVVPSSYSKPPYSYIWIHSEDNQYNIQQLTEIYRTGYAWNEDLGKVVTTGPFTYNKPDGSQVQMGAVFFYEDMDAETNETGTEKYFYVHCKKSEVAQGLTPKLMYRSDLAAAQDEETKAAYNDFTANVIFPEEPTTVTEDEYIWKITVKKQFSYFAKGEILLYSDTDNGMTFLNGGIGDGQWQLSVCGKDYYAPRGENILNYQWLKVYDKLEDEVAVWQLVLNLSEDSNSENNAFYVVDTLNSEDTNLVCTDVKVRYQVNSISEYAEAYKPISTDCITVTPCQELKNGDKVYKVTLGRYLGHEDLVISLSLRDSLGNELDYCNQSIQFGTDIAYDNTAISKVIMHHDYFAYLIDGTVPNALSKKRIEGSTTTEFYQNLGGQSITNRLYSGGALWLDVEMKDSHRIRDIVNLADNNKKLAYTINSVSYYKVFEKAHIEGDELIPEREITLPNEIAMIFGGCAATGNKGLAVNSVIIGGKDSNGEPILAAEPYNIVVSQCGTKYRVELVDAVINYDITITDRKSKAKVEFLSEAVSAEGLEKAVIAGESEKTLKVTEDSKTDAETAKMQSALEVYCGTDRTIDKILDISLENNQQLNAVVDVVIPLQEAAKEDEYQVVWFTDDGTPIPMATEYVDGGLMFKTGHFSTYALVKKTDAAATGTITANINNATEQDEIKIKLYDGNLSNNSIAADIIQSTPELALLYSPTETGGKYVFSSIKAGNYKLVVYKEGYVPEIQEITVVGDQTVIESSVDCSNMSNLLDGDVNLDGKVSAADITQLARYIAKIENFPNEEIISRCNFNNDNETTAADLTRLARYIAGIDRTL